MSNYVNETTLSCHTKQHEMKVLPGTQMPITTISTQKYKTSEKLVNDN